MTAKQKSLLGKVKAHLIIQHSEDDEQLLVYIAAAIDYAEHYQKVKYGNKKFPPTTEQAIIMLAGHFFESRDGGTGGFFSDYIGSVSNTWDAIHRLLAMNKSWEV